MSGFSDTRARKQFLLLGLLFLGPVLVAAFMYFGGDGWRPVATTNYGRLLLPVSTLGEPGNRQPLSALTAGQTDNHWILVYVNTAECLDTCMEALYRQRQSRMMLGNDVRRMKRVFLQGAKAPDKVFLDEHHQDLIAIVDSGLGELLNTRRPDNLPAGGLYLIDPLGNLVMYFSAELAQRDVVDDLKHLLNLSRIG